MKLYTVIVAGTHDASDPKAYRVRAFDSDLALMHARTIYTAHTGTQGRVLFVMVGAPVFLPTYTRDDFPDKGVIDLGTAQFGD